MSYENIEKLDLMFIQPSALHSSGKTICLFTFKNLSKNLIKTHVAVIPQWWNEFTAMSYTYTNGENLCLPLLLRHYETKTKSL